METKEGTTTVQATKRWDPAGLYPMAWPVYLELIAGAVAGIISTIWVARLGAPALGAVTVSTTLENVLLGVALIVFGGTTVVLSQAFGAKDRARASAVVRHSAVLTVVLCVVVLGPLFLAREPLAHLFAGSGETGDTTIKFLTVAIPGVTVYFAQNTVDALFKGSGDTRTPMRMAILVSAILLVGDPILIFGLLGAPKLGVVGAAVSTIIGRAIVLAITILLYVRRYRRDAAEAAANPVEPTTLATSSVPVAIVRSGLPMAVDFIARMAAGMVVVSFLARVGAAYLAAYGVVTRFLLFFTMAAYAIRQAATIVGARARGAADALLAAATRRSALSLGVGLSIIAALTVALAGPPAIGALTGEADTRAAASQMVLWLAAYIAVLIMTVVLAGVFFGEARGGALATVTLFGVGLQVALIPALSATGLHTVGIWLAMLANVGLQIGFLFVMLRRNPVKPPAPAETLLVEAGEAA